MLVFPIDQRVLSVTVPFFVYWCTAGLYEWLSSCKAPWLNKYRIHSPEDEKHNLVPKQRVIVTVLCQHIVQMICALVLLDPPDTAVRTYAGQTVRFIGAVICLDAWQYAFHRLFHEVDWLYQNIHIWHHKIFITYASGALYQHPAEMLMMDMCSGLVAVKATGCSPLTAMCFWSLSYFKTVSDHTGLKFPFNPTNLPGWNNAEYHDIHHSPTGLQYNYAQPYFTFWDRVMGSYKNPLDGQALPGRKDD